MSGGARCGTVIDNRVGPRTVPGGDRRPPFGGRRRAYGLRRNGPLFRRGPPSGPRRLLTSRDRGMPYSSKDKIVYDFLTFTKTLDLASQDDAGVLAEHTRM